MTLPKIIRENVMTEESYFDRIFESLDYSDKEFCGMEFESCTFKECNFSDSNLTNNEFADCQFLTCNMSMVNLNNTSLKNVDFINCKLTGVDFGCCNDFLFSVTFTTCLLDYSVFLKNALKKSTFENCMIHEANVTESDLSGALFRNCDLLNTVFIWNNMTGADFTTAYNYSIDPAINRIQKAKFSYPGVMGLLDQYDIIVE